MIPCSRGFLGILIVAGLWAQVADPAPTSYVCETVDERGNLGGYTSLALDSRETYYLSYL